MTDPIPQDVLESTDLYPANHDVFIKRLDAGYRPPEDHDYKTFAAKAREEKEKKDDKPKDRPGNGTKSSNNNSNNNRA